MVAAKNCTYNKHSNRAMFVTPWQEDPPTAAIFLEKFLVIYIIVLQQLRLIPANYLASNIKTLLGGDPSSARKSFSPSEMSVTKASNYSL